MRTCIWSTDIFRKVDVTSCVELAREIVSQATTP